MSECVCMRERVCVCGYVREKEVERGRRERGSEGAREGVNETREREQREREREREREILIDAHYCNVPMFSRGAPSAHAVPPT